MTTSGCASLRHNLSVKEVIQAFLTALPAPPSATAEYDLADEDSKQQIRVLKTGAAHSTNHSNPTCNLLSSHCGGDCAGENSAVGMDIECFMVQ